MRHKLPVLTAVLLLVGGMQVIQGDGRAAPKDLREIQPPGGVPLPLGEPGTPITTDYIQKATKRLEAVPEADLVKWVAELERLTDTKFDSDLDVSGCRTYFVTRMSVAFVDLDWNPNPADNYYRRAQSLQPSAVKAWREAFEALLKKEIPRGYAVPLVLSAADALHQEQNYDAERGRKYLARLKQLTAGDVGLWKAKVDTFGGTELDAAVNIALLDEYFGEETFQREKFKAAVAALGG